MKVRTGQKLVYRCRSFLDTMYPRPTDGTKVRVINLHGCPPPNTMGHCYIEPVDPQPEHASFYMVSTQSLHKS